MSGGPAARSAVYIVDDDAAVRQSLKFALGIDGFDVAVFPNAAEILGVSDRIKGGCLVLDYVLPDMNGLELVGRLRALGVQAAVILITTNPGADLLRRASAEGIRVVEKPLIGESLGKAIRASLG